MLVLRGCVFLSHNDVSAVVITSLFSPVCAVASSLCVPHNQFLVTVVLIFWLYFICNFYFQYGILYVLKFVLRLVIIVLIL